MMTTCGKEHALIQALKQGLLDHNKPLLTAALSELSFNRYETITNTDSIMADKNQ